MNRRFRLTRSSDFKRVRTQGKSYTHPLVVLVVMPNETEDVRVGVAAAKSVGKAVSRNRVKRLLRTAMSDLINQVVPGHDLILIARAPMVIAKLPQTQEALITALGRANLIKKPDEA